MIVNKSYFEEVKNETLFFLDSLETDTDFKFLPVKRVFCKLEKIYHSDLVAIH